MSETSERHPHAFGVWHVAAMAILWAFSLVVVIVLSGENALAFATESTQRFILEIVFGTPAVLTALIVLLPWLMSRRDCDEDDFDEDAWYASGGRTYRQFRIPEIEYGTDPIRDN